MANMKKKNYNFGAMTLLVSKNKSTEVARLINAKKKAIEQSYKKAAAEFTELPFTIKLGAAVPRPRSVVVSIPYECSLNLLSDAIGEQLGNLNEFVKLPYWG